MAIVSKSFRERRSALDMPLDLKIILACVFIQAGLTFFGVIRLGLIRVKALQATDLAIRDIALGSSAYPEDVRKHGNNLSNQFEFPVLFYVVAILAIVLEASSMMLALASVGFVAMRVVHRIIHVGSNHVIRRFYVFLFGIVFLFSAWVALGLTLVGAL